MLKPFFIAFALLAALLPVSPASAANLGIAYENRTPFELIAIRADLETTQGLRKVRSRVNLASGGTYSIGVNGAIKPLRIQMELVDGRLEFNDLSGLEMKENMILAVVHENGEARLEQDGPDAPRVARGKATWFVTGENRGNAVAKAAVTAAKSLDEVRKAVGDAVAAGKEEWSFDVEAGPIWSNDHARTRCPAVLAEWNEALPPGQPKARWTGQWSTTRPDEMSVCGFIASGAGLEKTLIAEDDGGILYFPATWAGQTGMGMAQSLGDSAAGITILLRLAVKDETLEAVFADLAEQGYRPWTATVETQDPGDSHELRYAESGKDAAGDMAALLASITALRGKGALRDSRCLLVTGATFAEGKAGNAVPPAPGVVLRVGPGNLEGAFLPDCSYSVR